MDEDFAADPRLIPSAVRRPWADVEGWASAFAGRPTVVICQKGEKLSHGLAAWLRHLGVAADSLEGGALAWAAADLPMVPVERLPRRDPHGRTVWVTRERPKVDRIACPWLIRRFVDPTAVLFSWHLRKSRQWPIDLAGLPSTSRGSMYFGAIAATVAPST